MLSVFLQKKKKTYPCDYLHCVRVVFFIYVYMHVSGIQVYKVFANLFIWVGSYLAVRMFW